MTNVEFYDKIFNEMCTFAQEYIADDTPRTIKETRLDFTTRAKEVCEDVVKESQVRHKPSRTVVLVTVKSLAPQNPRTWMIKMDIGTGNLIIKFKMDFKEKTCTWTRSSL